VFFSPSGGRKLYIGKSAADKERMDLSAELFTTETLRHGEIKNGVLRASVVEN
jgi:hypothetical protein